MLSHRFAHVLCVAVFLLSAHASAEASPQADKVSIAGIVGYGFNMPLRAGVGLRGGYTLSQNIYLGATFTYHFGEPAEFIGSLYLPGWNIYHFGFEGGYDIAFGPVIIRPYLGVGVAVEVVGQWYDCLDCGAEALFALWPGVTALVTFGHGFAGIDFRGLMAISSDYLDGTDVIGGPAIFATVGVAF